MFEGIIAHLTSHCGGSVHDKGVVNVTGSDFLDESLHPKNAAEWPLDSASGEPFWSSNDPGQWLCYDFKQRRVIPKSYALRMPDSHHPESWVFEASNDGTSWVELDRRDSNSWNTSQGALGYCNLWRANLEISPVPSERFRFVRFRMTGKNHHEDDYLIIFHMEIFGTLFPQ